MRIYFCLLLAIPFLAILNPACGSHDASVSQTLDIRDVDNEGERLPPRPTTKAYRVRPTSAQSTCLSEANGTITDARRIPNVVTHFRFAAQVNCNASVGKTNVSVRRAPDGVLWDETNNGTFRIILDDLGARKCLTAKAVARFSGASWNGCLEADSAQLWKFSQNNLGARRMISVDATQKAGKDQCLEYTLAEKLEVKDCEARSFQWFFVP